jgi:hypothetical protein
LSGGARGRLVRGGPQVLSEPEPPKELGPKNNAIHANLNFGKVGDGCDLREPTDRGERHYLGGDSGRCPIGMFPRSSVGVGAAGRKVAVAKRDSIALIIERCRKNSMSSVSTDVEHSERTKRLRPLGRALASGLAEKSGEKGLDRTYYWTLERRGEQRVDWTRTYLNNSRQ